MGNRNWFKYEPEEESRMSHVGYFLTPCEVLRQVYAMTDNPEIRMKLRIATSMCKSMATRLTTYEGKGWGKRVYPINPKLKDLS
jgi:hypothetical protein